MIKTMTINKNEYDITNDGDRKARLRYSVDAASKSKETLNNFNAFNNQERGFREQISDGHRLREDRNSLDTSPDIRVQYSPYSNDNQKLNKLLLPGRGETTNQYGTRPTQKSANTILAAERNNITIEQLDRRTVLNGNSTTGVPTGDKVPTEGNVPTGGNVLIEDIEVGILGTGHVHLTLHNRHLLQWDYSRPAYYPWKTTPDYCSNYAVRSV